MLTAIGVTRAAFFSSLGANLRITDDDLNLPSPLNTPSLRPYDVMSAPAHSPLASLAASTTDGISKIANNDLSAKKAEDEAAPVDPLAGIPELNTYAAESEEDQVAGLKLVADSIAQQRQTASRILIFHPLSLGIFSVVLALVTQWIYKDQSDIARVLTTWAGLTMAYLLVVRLFTKDYLTLAEEINWDWLGGDRIMVTKFGDEVIGALVLGWVAGEGRGSRRKRTGRGLIRAWTVKLRYRGKGVGTGLLEEAVSIATEKGGDGIDFAEEHASTFDSASLRSLPILTVRLQTQNVCSRAFSTRLLTNMR